MSVQVINPRIRGFLCLTSHPVGCATNVRRQVATAKRDGPGKGIGNALVIGSSAGYGLSSLLTTVFGYGADALSVCFERPGNGDKAGSGGWYNLAEAHRLAKADGRMIRTINGDAFSTGIKQQTIAMLKEHFKNGGKLDYVVYSLASPKRTDPATGTTFASTLKPINQAYTSKTINLDTDQIAPISIQPATDADIESTRKVMGGDDWELWMNALIDADLLADGCRSVAYSYIGPKLTYPIYRSGTIGKAKEHIEATAKKIDTLLAKKVKGNAWISVNKALVTQASSAIPVVPLYISLLYKVMKAKGSHEGTIEQITRLFRSHIGPGVKPTLDNEGRIRIDDWEMASDVQEATAKAWEIVTSENLAQISDYVGFKCEFRQLFGFEVPGVSYEQAVETEVPLA
jgi:enoyl-[acyl-carrier protein] reductase/trans-2-enoyl-CoA reductase (NAD+)